MLATFQPIAKVLQEAAREESVFVTYPAILDSI